MLNASRVSTIAAIALISLAVQSGQVQAGIVIGDFEGPGTAQLDGWSVVGANAVFAGDDVGAIWSSTGSGSLAVLFESDTAFQWQLQYNDVSTLAQLASSAPGAGIISADVYWLTSDWNGVSGWNRWDNVSLNSALGWKQTNDSLMEDSANPSAPGSWDPVNWGASHQRTLTWDLSSLLTGGTPQDILDGGWAQLNLSVNGDTGPGTSGIMYIDNIQMTIPEPTTFSLLGLVTATMLVVRRRIHI